jgi:phosphosulfolactate synthase
VILPEHNPFQKIMAFPLGVGTPKPRARGLTMVIDQGLGVDELNNLLETAGSYVDILKFGYGTSMLYPKDVLKRKLSLAKLYTVFTCTGGTLAEVAIMQGVFHAFVDKAVSTGFTSIEISDGTISLHPDERRRAISYAAKKLKVITEVGKKLVNITDPGETAKQIMDDLESGSSLVILEGRDSGESAGIYGKSGEVLSDLLERLLEQLPPSAHERCMYEAPKKSQQVELIQRFGPEVNLGNIHPKEVMSLECLRRGLGSDTLSIAITPGSNQ